MKELILNLKSRWFHKYKYGFKGIDYREIKPYWQKRLCKNFKATNISCINSNCVNCKLFDPIIYDRVILKEGYPSNNDINKILTRLHTTTFITKLDNPVQAVAEESFKDKYMFGIILK